VPANDEEIWVLLTGKEIPEGKYEMNQFGRIRNVGWDDRLKEARLAAEQALRNDAPDAIEAFGRLMRMVGSHERPTLFLELAPLMSDDMFWRAVWDEWSSFDLIPHEKFQLIFIQRMGSWSRNAMKAGDRRRYAKLPQVFTAYRGSDLQAPIGLSWTLDWETAKGFARGHRGMRNVEPVIFEAQIDKHSVAAFLTARSEEELVLFTIYGADVVDVHPLDLAVLEAEIKKP
jgi:hypothetical protein